MDSLTALLVRIKQGNLEGERELIKIETLTEETRLRRACIGWDIQPPWNDEDEDEGETGPPVEFNGIPF